MIPQIVEHYKPIITGIPWVERYGGLVKIVRKKVDGEVQTFPISCNVNEEDCFRNGRYQELVPNSAYKSIVYWQETRSVKIRKDVRNSLRPYEALTFDGQLQLVIWLNMSAFGFESCDASTLFAAEVIKKMTQFHETFQAPYRLLRFSMIPAGISTDSSVVFKGLTYAQDERLNLYPFASLGITWNIGWDVLPKCLPDVNTGDPINCVDFSL